MVLLTVYCVECCPDLTAASTDQVRPNLTDPSDRGTPQSAEVNEECTGREGGNVPQGCWGRGWGGSGGNTGGWGGTEGSFVRQEATKTKACSLGTVEEQREPWDIKKKCEREHEEEACSGGSEGRRPLGGGRKRVEWVKKVEDVNKYWGEGLY